MTAALVVFLGFTLVGVAIVAIDHNRRANKPVGYTVTAKGQTAQPLPSARAAQVAADAIIEAILNGRQPLAVKVQQHPCGAFHCDVICDGDAVEEAEAIVRETA